MTTPTITINPIDNGTDVITAANNAAGVVWSGQETGLNGQTINIDYEEGYGDYRGMANVYPPAVAANGTWSTTSVPETLFQQYPEYDGVYDVGVSTPSASPTVKGTDTIIVANHATAFEVVGMAFLDVSQQLVDEPFVSSIGQELTAEKAGLQILLNPANRDAFPIGPLHELLNDVNKELRILGSVPPDPATHYAVPDIIAKLQTIQGTMAAFVHDTPALVAHMPDGAGW
jgi:hypothetical protein